MEELRKYIEEPLVSLEFGLLPEAGLQSDDFRGIEGRWGENVKTGKG